MPWQTPTLEDVRTLNRDNVQSQLRSGPMIPNSVLRVMSDSNAGLAYLTLLYLDWLAKQLMPDTAEEEWLDRHGDIWRPGGSSRKAATYAQATINFTAVSTDTLMPAGTEIIGVSATPNASSVIFQTQTDTTIGITNTAVNVVAIDAGATGLVVGSGVSLASPISGINTNGTIATITDGIGEETDESLRERVLDRIRQPPVGGDAQDYVDWAKATPGVPVTRAWCSPQEMGIGTVSIRFMVDDLVNNVPGFPTQAQIDTVTDYIDTVRPVALKDRFVTTCVPEPINFTVSNLSPDTVANRNAIVTSVRNMLFERAAPAHAINGIEQNAQTIYAAWVSEAISSIGTIDSFTLTMTDHSMPEPGSLAVLGNVVYG